MSNKNAALQQKKKIDYLKRFYRCNNMTIRIEQTRSNAVNKSNFKVAFKFTQGYEQKYS